MALYKTKNGQQTGSVSGVGEIVNGMLHGPDGLEGSNLELIKTTAQEEKETQANLDQPQDAPAAPAASNPPANPPQSAPVNSSNPPANPQQPAQNMNTEAK